MLARMCGRYASTRSSADLAALFEALDETDGTLVADYNVAPTDPGPIVRQSARAGRVLTVARWGLVPAWSNDASGGARMINARAETVATSRAFARPYAERRCLVPADGWYEWRRLPGGARQPYFMTREDGGPLAFAGVWSAWAPPTGVAESAPLITFSVLTMPAAARFAPVHDRMPLVLEPIHWASWLTGPEPAGLLSPPSGEYAAGIELRPVSPAVGNVRNDGPDLVRPVSLPIIGDSTVDESNSTLF